jgi:hypothetical protein
MKRISKAVQLTEEQKFALDGYLCNGNKSLCYRLANQSKAKAESVLVMANRWFSTDLVKNYLEVRRAQIFPDKEDTTKDYTDKSVLLSELSRLVNRTTNIREKNDLLKTVADVTRMKNDENKDEAKLIHFYVPLTCKRCNLYVAEMEKRKEKQKQK